MPKSTTDFQEFLDGEDLSSDNFELTYELYCLVDGAEERGTYKAVRHGDSLAITSPGNAYKLALVSPAAIKAFKIYMQRRYMEGNDVEAWYALKVSTKYRD